MLPLRNEIMNFIRACEALHTMFDQGALTLDDRTLILTRGGELLRILRTVC